MEKKKNTVLILGATSTVASDIARIYAREGKKLYLIGRSPQKLEKLTEELKDNVIGTKILDFQKTKSLENEIQDSLKKIDRIDIAIIAHGDLGDQLKSEKKFEHALKIFEINCLSTIALIIPLANHLEKQNHGKLVTIGSVAGERGRPRNYTYGAAKGSVRLYLQGLRSRLWKTNVSIHYIKMGPVDTPMTIDHKKNFSFTTSPKAAQGIVNAIKKGKPEAFVPKYWCLVMFMVKVMPEYIFQRLKFLSSR